MSSDFTRATTVIHLRGGGHEGVGEDVTYDALDHVALQEAGPVQDLAGSWTLGSFFDHVGGARPVPGGARARDVAAVPPLGRSRARRSTSRCARAASRWRTRSGASCGRSRSSCRCGSAARRRWSPSRRRLERYPTLRFKLDPTGEWTDELIAQLVDTGAVDSVDLKAFYTDTVVDNPPEPGLYRRVAEAFPDAWIEDAGLTDETRPVLEPHKDRLTWDAPIHSIADIEALPFPPRMVNVKPSRFGSVKALMDAYDYLAERGIGAYGGGQFELGPGRGHIQYLASLFHPDTPNDVAPGGYNLVDPPAGLPDSPLEPRPSKTGFRWEG